MATSNDHIKVDIDYTNLFGIDFTRYGKGSLILAYDLDNTEFYWKLRNDTNGTLVVMDDENRIALMESEINGKKEMMKQIPGLVIDIPEMKVVRDVAELGKEIASGGDRIIAIPLPDKPLDFLKTFATDLENNNMKKFDLVVGNPPYDGSLHLEILKTMLECLDKEHGELCFVEPATWLINVRKNGNAKLYDKLKHCVEGHVKSIVIENLNRKFNISNYTPLSITHIDFSRKYDTIDFSCCGERKCIASIYDANLIGSYNTIWSILNKVGSFGDMMCSHTTNKEMGEGVWYAKYAEMMSGVGASLCALGCGNGGTYDGDATWCETSNGKYVTGFISPFWHYYMNSISNKPLCGYTKGRQPTDKIVDNIYGTRAELENWKHFVFNNKLPLFINIVLTIDQHNNSSKFLPWLVDKKYTDEEIYKKFNLTDEEIALIDVTLKKFERNSPWFKRYICGASAN